MMKVIWCKKWEIEAMRQNRKTSKRIPLYPQPVMEKSGMWYWKDCQWMDGGLGFPQSGIEDHFEYQPGDIVWARHETDNREAFFRVDKVWVERLQDISEGSAMKESFMGEFSGTGEAAGSGWIRTSCDEFAQMWDKHQPTEEMLKTYGWDANPWVTVMEFTVLCRDEALIASGYR